jgi:hypothetical protein
MKQINNMSYEQLRSEFADLLAHNLIIKAKYKTFFDIAGFPDYEQVVSNIYKYFFDPDESHGLKNLFLDSLLELAGSDMTFHTVKIKTEVFTDNGGRIDILITDESAGQKKIDNAIIIENKVYASLYNDLEDYYDSVKAGNKLGIVLSPKKLSNLKDKHHAFINILHGELMQKVKSNIGPYFNAMPEKAYTFLKEFILNLEAMSISEEKKDQLKFYYENRTKIDQLASLKDDAKQFLIDQCYKLMPYGKWKWNRVYERGFILRFGERGLSLFFHFDELSSDNKISAGFWYLHKDIANTYSKRINIEKIKDKFGDCFEYPADKDGRNSFQIAAKEWQIGTFEEFIDLKSLFVEILDKDFTPLAEFTEEVIYAK